MRTISRRDRRSGRRVVGLCLLLLTLLVLLLVMPAKVCHQLDAIGLVGKRELFLRRVGRQTDRVLHLLDVARDFEPRQHAYKLSRRARKK